MFIRHSLWRLGFVEDLTRCRGERRMNIHRYARTTFASRVLVERVCKQWWSIEDAASAFGISGSTVRKWLTRYREFGLDGLRDRTSKPPLVRGAYGLVRMCFSRRHAPAKIFDT
jgi:hypothetical protein